MSETTALLQTPLYDWHIHHGGRMVEFAGWSMPVQYGSIVDEHVATRTAVGLFDVSHMGRLSIGGRDAVAFLDRLLTRRVTNLRQGRARYSFICNENGGILDDVLIYHLDASDAPGGDAAWQLVVNASNREKIINWINQQATEFDVSMEDRTASTAMIAVQGPQALGIADGMCDKPLASLKYFQTTWCRCKGMPAMVSRTGYTGEDGVELFCRAEEAGEIWQTLFDAAAEQGGKAAGLGARDTLRLESALPLYGHELEETINPIQTGLTFAYDLGSREFVGSEAMMRLQEDETQPRLAGLTLQGRRPARQGARVYYAGVDVGEITSGTLSPTLQRPIALAYLQPPANIAGREMTVDIRGTQHVATVCALPFYRRDT